MVFRWREQDISYKLSFFVIKPYVLFNSCYAQQSMCLETPRWPLTLQFCVTLVTLFCAFMIAKYVSLFLIKPNFCNLSSIQFMLHTTINVLGDAMLTLDSDKLFVLLICKPISFPFPALKLQNLVINCLLLLTNRTFITLVLFDSCYTQQSTCLEKTRRWPLTVTNRPFFTTIYLAYL